MVADIATRLRYGRRMSETAADSVYQPSLGRFPNGRASWIPLLQPFHLAYCALLFGAGVGAGLGVLNALGLRRPGLALKSILLGGLTVAIYLLVLGLLWRAGMENVGLLLVLGRIVHALGGFALALLHHRHALGSVLVDGRLVPILPGAGALFVLHFIVPVKTVIGMMGLYAVWGLTP